MPAWITIHILTSHPEIRDVVISGQFLNAFDIPGRPVYLVPDDCDRAGEHSRMERITDRIIGTARLLKQAGKKVVLIGTFYATESQGAA